MLQRRPARAFSAAVKFTGRRSRPAGGSELNVTPIPRVFERAFNLSNCEGFQPPAVTNFPPRGDRRLEASKGRNRGKGQVLGDARDYTSADTVKPADFSAFTLCIHSRQSEGRLSGEVDDAVRGRCLLVICGPVCRRRPVCQLRSEQTGERLLGAMARGRHHDVSIRIFTGS
jgi:hypothetical protein